MHTLKKEGIGARRRNESLFYALAVEVWGWAPCRRDEIVHLSRNKGSVHARGMEIGRHDLGMVGVRLRVLGIMKVYCMSGGIMKVWFMVLE